MSAGLNVRVPLEQLTQLHKLAADRGTTVSEEVRRALAEAHDPQVSAIEFEGLTGGVTLTIRFADGWNEALALDVEQARELWDHLAVAIEAAG